MAENAKLRSSGNWCDSALWGHGEPTPDDKAIIGAGLTAEVTLGEAAADNISLGDRSGPGTLVMRNGDLSVGSLTVGADSRGNAGVVNQSGGRITITYERPPRREFTRFEWEKAADYYARYLRFMKQQGFAITYLDAINEAGRLFRPEDLEKMIGRLREKMGKEMPLVIAPSGFGWGDTVGWITNAVAGGHAAFWDITSSHDCHGPDSMDAFVAVAKTLGRPVWNTELHVVRGPDDRAAPNMNEIFRPIRAGLCGLNPWLSLGNEKKAYCMFRNVDGRLVLMRTYYIYRHLVNTSNGGRYLASNVPEPLSTTAAFHSEAKRLVTVWVLNSTNAPVDTRVVLDGRFASARLAEIRWWGPDNAREGTSVTHGLSDVGSVRRTISTNSLYCFSFRQGDDTVARTADTTSAEPRVALVRVTDTPQQRMTYGHDFERLWHFTDGGKEIDYDELAKAAVGECDVDYVRVAISGAAELEEGKIDWSAYDRELAIMRALKRARPGIKFFASPRPIHNDQPTQELRKTGPYAPFPLWINVFEHPFQDTSGKGALKIGEQAGTVGTYNLSGGTTVVHGVEMQLGGDGNGQIRISGTGVLDLPGTRLSLAGSGGTAAIEMTGGELHCMHLGFGGKHAVTNGTLHLSGGSLTAGMLAMSARGGTQTLRISGTNATLSLHKDFTMGDLNCTLHVELDTGGVSPISARGNVALDGTLKVGRLAGRNVPRSATLIKGTSVRGSFSRVQWLDGLSGEVIYDRAKGEVRIEKIGQP